MGKIWRKQNDFSTDQVYTNKKAKSGRKAKRLFHQINLLYYMIKYILINGQILAKSKTTFREIDTS